MGWAIGLGLIPGLEVDPVGMGPSPGGCATDDVRTGGSRPSRGCRYEQHSGGSVLKASTPRAACHGDRFPLMSAQSIEGSE